MASATVPDPLALTNLHAMILTFQFIPTTPCAIVPDCTNDSGNVRPMIVVVHRIGVVVHRVDAETVIDKAVAVIVDSIIVAIGCVTKHVGRKV